MSPDALWHNARSETHGQPELPAGEPANEEDTRRMPFHIPPRLGLAALALGVILAGCAAPEEKPSDPPASSPTDAAEAPTQRQLGVAGDGPAVGGDRREVPDAEEGQAACREILVRYAGAVAAGDGVTRSHDEAKALAESILDELEGGADFNALVAEYSEGPTVDREGFIPPFTRGSRPRAFEDAAFSLEVGEVSGVLETPYGFHILKGEDGTTYLAMLILISHADSPAAPSRVERGRLDAVRLAAELRARVVAHPDSFPEIAREYSDGAGRDMGGRLGSFHRYTYGKYFGDIVAGLEPGEISEVFETRQGFNILKRMPFR